VPGLPTAIHTSVTVSLLMFWCRWHGLLHTGRRAADWLAEAGGESTTRWRRGIPGRHSPAYI